MKIEKILGAVRSSVEQAGTLLMDNIFQKHFGGSIQ